MVRTMTPRQRGACWLLLLILAGRLLDALDLPFERPAHDTTRQAAAIEAEGSPSGSIATQPLVSPAAAAPDSAETASHSLTTIRINHATAKELQALPGVGPVLASRIVAYRAEHGPLGSLAETRRIKGIGPRMMQRLAPLLRFD
jgi:competence protein ComEA